MQSVLKASVVRDLSSSACRHNQVLRTNAALRCEDDVSVTVSLGSFQTQWQPRFEDWPLILTLTNSHYSFAMKAQAAT
eukprot:5789154-Amphidinium_carterae.1